MNNCSPWIHEIYQGIFEICTDLGILVVNAKYAQKYTVAYTRFFAQCQFDIPGKCESQHDNVNLPWPYGCRLNAC